MILYIRFFVTYGKNIRREIKSIPGCFQESVDKIVKHAKRSIPLGIPAVILFEFPNTKMKQGQALMTLTESYRRQ